MAVGAFVFVTTENLPVGLLPQVAAGLGSSESTTGLLVTAYAGAVVLTAIPMTALTIRWERRRLLLCVLGTLVLSNLVGAAVESFAPMLAARIACGVAHGVFWAMIASLAGRLLPGQRQARATSLVFIGISLALVGGIPLSALLGQAAGWRVSFLAAAAIGALAMAAVLLSVPRTPAVEGAKVESPLWLLGHRQLRRTVIGTALVYGAHFVAFTFVTLFATRVAGLGEGGIGPLLLAFGAIGIAGTVAAGRVDERRLGVAARGWALLLAGVLVALTAGGDVAPVAAMAIAGWGAAIAGVAVVLQTQVIALAPDAPDAASSLYVVAANLGIGGGALVGGLLMPLIGLRPLAGLAAGLALAAVAVMRDEGEQHPHTH